MEKQQNGIKKLPNKIMLLLNLISLNFTVPDEELQKTKQKQQSGFKKLLTRISPKLKLRLDFVTSMALA